MVVTYQDYESNMKREGRKCQEKVKLELRGVNIAWKKTSRAKA